MIIKTKYFLNIIISLIFANNFIQNAAKIVHYSLTVSYVFGAPDGVTKRMLGFNNLSPGPTLRASKGDELVVAITNRIDPKETTTIHWHGIEQFHSPFQDGPRMITQCDIPFNVTHTYRFLLRQSGTYWYHAHHTGQLTDGLWGALLVDNTPAEVHQYDGEFLITLKDWYHLPSTTLSDWYEDLSRNPGSGLPAPDSFHMNGLGEYPCDLAKQRNLTCNPGFGIRYKLLEVERGKTYRFRVLNSATVTLFALMIDGHKLEVIETDGVDTVRVAGVDRATVSTGARTSFLVKMDGNLDQYWIRVWGDLQPFKLDYPNINPFPDYLLHDPWVYAVLRYKDGAGGGEPVSIGEGINENAVQGRPDHHTDWKTGNEATSGSGSMVFINGLRAYQDILRLPEATPPFPSTKMHPNPTILNHRDCIPYGGVTAPNYVNQTIRISTPSVDVPGQSYKPGFNNITFSTKSLNKPALIQSINGEGLPASLNPVHIKGFGEDYVVEMIFSDFGTTGHPIHLHGHTFWVMGYGAEGEGPFSEWRHRPLLKTGVRRETMAVLLGSWTVIRFRADNPGVWLLHCHMNFHFEVSMGMVLVEGGEKNLKAIQIPKDMRTLCAKAGVHINPVKPTKPPKSALQAWKKCKLSKPRPNSVGQHINRKMDCWVKLLQGFYNMRR